MTNQTSKLFRFIMVALLLAVGISSIVLRGSYSRLGPFKAVESSNSVVQEIAELAGDQSVYDWSDYSQIKYYIELDITLGYGVVKGANTKRIPGVSYFKTASQAGEVILYLGDKLKEGLK